MSIPSSRKREKVEVDLEEGTSKKGKKGKKEKKEKKEKKHKH